jgi:low affinity Fe/Cu permease
LPEIRLFRHLATRHQHHDYDHHVPHVFIIQNTQNRDAKAIQLKLDELIRAVQGARTGLVRLEELSDQDLQSLAGDFEKLRARSGDQAAADESG